MSGLLVAVSFLTRVPVGAGPIADARDVAGSDVAGRDAAGSDGAGGDGAGSGRLADDALATAVPWFPVVGASVGVAVGLVYWTVGAVLPPGLAATLAIATGVAVTGAFHEDGLADSADALWGGFDRARRLSILRDSRHGTFGVAALSLSLVARVTALAALPRGRVALGALLAAHALARGGAVAVMGTTPPARAEGLGASYVSALGPKQVWAGVAASIVLGAIGIGGWVVAAWAALVIVAISVRRVALDKLGGIVGDVLGAVEQLGELAALAVTVAVVYRGWRPLGWWPR